MDKILNEQYKFWDSFTTGNFICVCSMASEMQHEERHDSPLCSRYVIILTLSAERRIALLIMKRFSGRRSK